MNDILRERLISKLDTLPEEKIYQILDYIDFLESKYAPKVSAAPNPLKRFAEGVEDTLRAGRMSAGVIGGTMNVMNKAVGVVTDVANAGKSVATEIAGVVSSVTSTSRRRHRRSPASPTGTTPPRFDTDVPPSPATRRSAQVKAQSQRARRGSIRPKAAHSHRRRALVRRQSLGSRATADFTRSAADGCEAHGDGDDEGAAEFPAAPRWTARRLRVSTLTDKLLVAGAFAYILLPMDFVPDFIPFLGEVDDIFLLVMALQRLIANAGTSGAVDHWMGDPKYLSALDLERVLTAAAFFLPRRIRRRLKAIGRDY